LSDAGGDAEFRIFSSATQAKAKASKGFPDGLVDSKGFSVLGESGGSGLAPAFLLLLSLVSALETDSDSFSSSVSSDWLVELIF